jgi:type I restriction enzyme, S subunit
MLDDGWKQRGFASLIDGGILQIGDGYRAKNSELGADGPLFLRAGHVADTHIDFNGVERFRSELVGQLTHKMSKVNDVIVTTKGNSTGRVSYVSSDMPPFVYSPHLSFWRSMRRDLLCPGFLRYWSRGREFREQLAGLKASTDMAPYLSLADQKRLKISLPPISHQRAIAQILGSLDDKIDLNRRMNETLEAMARAIFKSWFVDFDPIRAKMEGRKPVGMDAETASLFPESVEESPLGLIPSSWRVTSIDDFCARVTDGAHESPPSVEDGLPMASVKDLTKWGIELSGCRLISDNDFRRLPAKARRCPACQGWCVLPGHGL